MDHINLVLSFTYNVTEGTARPNSIDCYSMDKENNIEDCLFIWTKRWGNTRYPNINNLFDLVVRYIMDHRIDAIFDLLKDDCGIKCYDIRLDTKVY